MNINWNDIRYIFQLPLQWFKTISDKVFNAYGTNFLTIKDGMYGGMEFGIDEQVFANAVENAGKDKYVTIDTNQSITGLKTFTSDIAVSNGSSTSYIGMNSDQHLEVDTNSTIDAVATGIDVIHPINDSHTTINAQGNIEIYPQSTAQHGGYIDFHLNGSTADYTSRIIEGGQSFTLTTKQKDIVVRTEDSQNSITLQAAADKVFLANNPTSEDPNSKLIATVGYCQTKFGKVKSIDGVTPDANGNISLSDVIDLSTYVTLDTNQEITGQKTFSDDIVFDNGTYAGTIGMDNNSTFSFSALRPIDINTNYQVEIKNPINASHVEISPAGKIELYPPTTAQHGGYIDFHLNGSSADYTSRIIETASSLNITSVGKDITLQGNNTGLQLKSSDTVGEQLLIGEPNRLYSTGQDSQLASRGYVRLNFARASHTHGNITNDGKITTTTTGSTDYAIVTNANGDLFRKPLSQIIPSPQITTADITDWNTATADFVKQNDLSNYVTQEDLTTELADYVTQDDLTDYVTQEDFPQTWWQSLGQAVASQTFNVVTDVVWNGTTLQKKTRSITVSNGLITNIGNETTGTVDTPTVVTWR